MKRDYLVLLTNNYPFGMGEEFIQNEVGYLSEKFKRVFIFTLNTKDSLTKKVPGNFEIIRGDKSKIKILRMFFNLNFGDLLSEKNSLRNIKRLIKFQLKGLFLEKEILKFLVLKKLNFRDVSLYSYWMNESAYAISSLKKKLPELRVVSRAHGYDLYEERAYQPYKLITLKRLDYALPCSKQGEKYLKNKYETQNIKCSYLGTINEKSFELKKKSNIIVSCSYLSKVKRVDLLIEALSKVQRKIYGIKWIHIGSGSEEERIKNLAKEKLSNIHYEFLGHLENKKVLSFYAENNVNCLVNLSSTEGLPVSMMEAQSFGVPIIATNVGGVREIIGDDNGILLSENPTVSEVEKAIIKMFLLKEIEHQYYQKNSYKKWANLFNAEKNYNEFIEKYLKG